jgi:hypothetical protein
MGDCCGQQFKRGQPGKAANPNQQCFVDCCDASCPPDNCCDSITIHFECGPKEPPECTCDCEFNGYEFSGIIFKKRLVPTPTPLPTPKLRQGENP